MIRGVLSFQVRGLHLRYRIVLVIRHQSTITIHDLFVDITIRWEKWRTIIVSTK